MLKLLSTIILVLLLGSVVESMHLHPHSKNILEQSKSSDVPEDINNEDSGANIDGMSIDTIRHIKLTRFVPVNNALFFQSYSPCQNGFERDLFGVCREVW